MKHAGASRPGKPASVSGAGEHIQPMSSALILCSEGKRKMTVLLVLLALGAGLLVWWGLARSLRSSGRGFVWRHLLGCLAGWMVAFLVLGLAATTGVITLASESVTWTLSA